MKIVSLILLSILSVASNAQEIIPPNVRAISVSGTAERSLTANQVDISVKIRSVDESLAGAREKSNEVFESLLQNLARLEIKPEKVQLQDHEFGKEYIDGPNREKIWKGFYSSRSFVVMLEDVEKLELTHGELAENPDVQVNGTSFTRTDDIEIRKELRIEALKAAREKATMMASVYEQKIGKVLKISEGGGSPFSNSFETRNTGVTLTVKGSARGMVTLSTSVSAVFELVDS